MSLKVLTQSQVDQFVEEGYTLLKDAFGPDTARQVRTALFREIGLKEDDSSGWTQPVIHLQKSFNGSPYSDAYTSKLAGAFDDVMGEGRWNAQDRLGWWPITFPGFHKGPWQP